MALIDAGCPKLRLAWSGDSALDREVEDGSEKVVSWWRMMMIEAEFTGSGSQMQ
jgi:hypothetical protein